MVSSFLARRYFISRKGYQFVSFLSGVAILGVALSIFSLIVIISIMKGFNTELSNKLIGFNAHLTIRGADNWVKLKDLLAGDGRVARYSFVTEGDGLIVGEAPRGVIIRGVEGHEGLSIGSELAFELGIGEGDQIALATPFGSISPVGELIPHTRGYLVSEVFHSGHFEYDNKYVVMGLNEASSLLGYGGSKKMLVWLKKASCFMLHASCLESAISGLRNRIEAGSRRQEVQISDWTSENKKLFAALKLERITMAIILILTVAISSILIVSLILMLVFSKAKDIAILTSLGMRPNAIRRIFILLGTWVGGIGTSIGLLAGLITILRLSAAHIRLPESYYLNYLPVEVSPSAIIFTILAGLGISIAAAWYPAHEASRVNSIKVLRYE